MYQKTTAGEIILQLSPFQQNHDLNKNNEIKTYEKL